MLCARCDKPLSEADAVPVDVDHATGVGQTLYVHRYRCRNPQTQTAPVSSRRRIRGR